MGRTRLSERSSFIRHNVPAHGSGPEASAPVAGHEVEASSPASPPTPQDRDGGDRDDESARSDGGAKRVDDRGVLGLAGSGNGRRLAEHGGPDQVALTGLTACVSAGVRRGHGPGEQDFETERQLVAWVRPEEAVHLGRRQAERVADACGKARVIEARQPAAKVDGPRSQVMVLEQAGKLGDGSGGKAGSSRAAACDVGHQCRHLGELGEGVAGADHGVAFGAGLRPLDNPTSCPEISHG